MLPGNTFELQPLGECQQRRRASGWRIGPLHPGVALAQTGDAGSQLYLHF